MSCLTCPSKAPKAGAGSCRNAGFRIVERLQRGGILTRSEPWCVCASVRVHFPEDTKVSIQVSGLVIGCRHLILDHLVTVSATTASLKDLALHHFLSGM